MTKDEMRKEITNYVGLSAALCVMWADYKDKKGFPYTDVLDIAQEKIKENFENKWEEYHGLLLDSDNFYPEDYIVNYSMEL